MNAANDVMEPPAAGDRGVESSNEHAGAAFQPSVQGDLVALIQERVWLHVRRRKAWLDSLPRRATEGGPDEFFKDPDDPVSEERWQREGEGRIWNRPIREIEAAMAGHYGHPLRVLTETFGLTAAESDLLQTCVALQLDPALGQVFAYLHGQTSSGFASAPLVRRLFGHPTSSFAHPLANVIRWKLVHLRETAPGEPMAAAADPMLVPWFEGQLVLDPAIAGCIRRAPLHAPLRNWPIEDAVRVIAQSALDGVPVRLIVSGPPGSGRSSFIAAAAQQVGLECLVVDTSVIAEADWPDAFLKVLRFAVLGRFGVIWSGEHVDRSWPRGLQRCALHAVACERDGSAPVPGWSDVHIELPPPTLEERRSIWRSACPEFEKWSEDERVILCESYTLSPGQIASIGRMRPASGEQAIGMAREVTRQDIGNLGQFLPCPFNWDDMILSEDLLSGLKDLAYEARSRARFWDRREARRLFPRGTGLSALLSGPPGTGKTMAAQVIAAELKLDLFRVDLARVVSKYIGETAKHLSEIFARASRMSAVLLFDEADALFARRTQVKDSHDRYANADTSYLLQLLEEFGGLALLTTNKRGNIDPAFYRRLRYVYEFPKPGPADRLKIWQRLTTELHGEETCRALAKTLQTLAEQMAISPAQIKATLLASAFMAQRQGRPLQASDLIKALQREMAKEGRGVDDDVRNSMNKA